MTNPYLSLDSSWSIVLEYNLNLASVLQKMTMNNPQKVKKRKKQSLIKSAMKYVHNLSLENTYRYHLNVTVYITLITCKMQGVLNTPAGRPATVPHCKGQL